MLVTIRIAIVYILPASPARSWYRTQVEAYAATFATIVDDTSSPVAFSVTTTSQVSTVSRSLSPPLSVGAEELVIPEQLFVGIFLDPYHRAGTSQPRMYAPWNEPIRVSVKEPPDASRRR